MILIILKSSGKDGPSANKQISIVNYKFCEGHEHGVGIKNDRVGIFLRCYGVIVNNVDRNIQITVA